MKSILSILVTLALSVSAFGQAPLIRVNTIPDLVAVNLSSTNQTISAIVLGGASATDGQGGLFTYIGSSTASTNVYAIYKPNNIGGRWFKNPTSVVFQNSAVNVNDDTTYAWKLLRSQVNFLGIGADNNNGIFQTFSGKTLALNPIGNNVGIGTISPQRTLHVDSGGSGTVALFTASGIPSAKQLYLFADASVSGIAEGAAAGAASVLFSGTNVVIIRTDSTERMRVNAVGNVGIGTTTQAAKLAVNGGVHVGGDSDPGDNNLLVDGTITSVGNLIVSTAGAGLQIKEGSNARMGTATLSGGTIAVSNTSVATGDRIFITRVSGTAAEFGHLTYTISNGVSFTINSTDAQDDSVVNWIIIRPTP